MRNRVRFRPPRRMESYTNIRNVIRNIRWRYNPSTSQMPHVFVIGAPRSGTSLAYTRIRQHPVFSAIDAETAFFVRRDIFQRESYVRLEPYGGPTTQEIEQLIDDAHDLIDLYDRIAKLVCKRDGGSRFIEKTPRHTLYLDYLLRHYPKAQFINIIRDGRACYVSHLRLQHIHQRSLEQFAYLWRDSIRACLKWSTNSQILNIHYQQLTRQPQKTLQQTMNFLGEMLVPHQLETNKVVENSIYQNAPGHAKLSETIRPQQADKWREEMTPKQIRTFNRIAGKELQTLGYDVTG